MDQTASRARKTDRRASYTQLKKDDNWYDMQFIVNQFITGGLDAVQNGKTIQIQAEAAGNYPYRKSDYLESV